MSVYESQWVVSPLLSISPDMVLATRVVLLLARSSSGAASVRELCASARMSPTQAEDVIRHLVESGIVEQRPDDSTVSLSMDAGVLSLADVARSVGEWLLIDDGGLDPDPGLPGLPAALRIVRDRCLSDLERLTVSALPAIPG